jgi:DUF4097 and DUF4098 domain-containing protein YvlB
VNRVDLSTASGNVRLDDVSADVAVSTQSGNVSARALRIGRVQVHTASGNVSLGVPSPQDVHIDTASGTIVLDVPPGSYDVSSHTLSGNIDVGVTPDAQSSRHLALNSSSGNIAIRGNGT